MAKTPKPAPRREDALSRDRIIDAAVELLDAHGEDGLTFRALSQHLATGAGAIYWHVANKSDLLTAAADAIVARTLAPAAASKAPKSALRALALGLFDALDAHPWVGAALMHAPGQLPMVRILERIGRQVQALGVAPDAQWATASALLHYILGVGGQNAANRQRAQSGQLDRGDFMDAVGAQWLALDPDAYPFTRGMAGQLGAHDDRADFLAGLELMLGGLKAGRG